MILPACDALESGKPPTFFRERFKPTLDFRAVPEARTIAVFDVVVVDGEFRLGGGDLTPGQCFPARAIQQFHRGCIVQVVHEIDLGELHHC